MKIRLPQNPVGRASLIACLIWLVAGLLAVSLAHAEPPAAPPPAGFVDYQPFLKFADEDADIVEINVSSSLLRAIAGGASAKGDAELRGLFENLKGISALVVTVLPQQEEAARQYVESRGNELRQRGWEEVAKIRKKGEKVRVLALNQGDHIGGLVVMVLSREQILDDGEKSEPGKPASLQLVFANIAGKFSLEQLQKLDGKIDIPGLDSVIEEKGRGKPAGKSGKGPAESEDKPTPPKTSSRFEDQEPESGS